MDEAMTRVLCVFGTRPEAVKMEPVIAALRARGAGGSCGVILLATAQHREMLDDVMRVLEMKPDFDLNVMTDNQQPADVAAQCLVGIDRILRQTRPAMTIAQGDTTTVLAAALASYYNRVPFGHVEAGLRTHDKFAPFPEEMNRRVAGSLADLHFAPTSAARENLLHEGIPEGAIHVCGNTVVDAVQRIAARETPDAALPERIERLLASVAKPVLVTAHRRESFGAPLNEICHALREIVDADPEVGLIFPVHPNPNVRQPVHAILDGHPRIGLCDPIHYVQFVHLMRRSYLILTDSGGVQEEAPSLGKPVLVLREKTERPEGIAAGVARLVGTDRRRIVNEAMKLLSSPEEYRRMIAAGNPYGDGHAGERIAAIVCDFLGVSR
jgi:UDP-N-acetylglucosamine 2-epimerase (non-hydrolysing)